MQRQRTLEGAPTPQPTLVTEPAVPQRSARRATARRASTRRATARQRKDNVEARIVERLKDRPQSTTGDLAKALNADRGTIAAGVSHLLKASKIRQNDAGK